MLDVVSVLLAVNVAVFGRGALVPSGLPLALVVLSACSYASLLPPSMEHAQGHVDLARFVALALVQDAVQFVLHLLEHRLRLSSHATHHLRVRPSAGDAFKAAPLDALLQLLGPLLISLWAVRPSRETAIAFGAFYSLWLQHIHSDGAWAQSLRSVVFVTPQYHRRHHLTPHTNFGHLLTVWDALIGTARFF
tara:strand:+ start:372 stop:947 length:576 start_codon:yes stop_codon:yes gene_type:complete